NAGVSGPNGERAIAHFGSPGSIDLYRGFFEQEYRSSFVSNNSPATYWSRRLQADMARTIIHEGLHLLFEGASDVLYGELISGKPITGTTDERRKAGSQIISE